MQPKIEKVGVAEVRRVSVQAQASAATPAPVMAAAPEEKKFLGIPMFTWQKIVPLGLMFFWYVLSSDEIFCLFLFCSFRWFSFACAIVYPHWFLMLYADCHDHGSSTAPVVVVGSVALLWIWIDHQRVLIDLL